MLDLYKLEEELKDLEALKEYYYSEFRKEKRKNERLFISKKILCYGLPSLVLVACNLGVVKITEWNPFKLRNEVKEVKSYIETTVDEFGNESTKIVDKNAKDKLIFHENWTVDEYGTFVSDVLTFCVKDLTVEEVNNLNKREYLCLNDFQQYGIVDYKTEQKLVEITDEIMLKGAYVTAVIYDLNAVDYVDCKENWFMHFGKFILYLSANAFFGYLIFVLNEDILNYEFSTPMEHVYRDIMNEYSIKNTEYSILKEKVMEATEEKPKQMIKNN